ncbi:hypothetical protein BR93DRAFT_946102 [Coniochaeta sp. PMI_546]|nr:hypothetical protein BR93DRAFT_946102 [Coniochaeta sp. PMI_546]
MELSSSIFADVLSPLAIYIDDNDSEREALETIPENNSGPPSFRSRHTSRWKFGGVDTDGTRFFVVPTFAIGTPPMRVDVYIRPPEEHSLHVRRALKPEAAMYATDKKTAINLPVTQHLLQALDHWSSSLPGLRDIYLSLPFGSQIAVTELTLDPTETAASIQFMPNYEVEQAMMSLDSLQQMWPSDLCWPATIDTTDLLCCSQIHEAITIVTIPCSPHPDREYVFKSLLREQKYLYNELKMLLTLQPHDNLIPRPLYIVTHKCRFGGKSGVAGFILEYYPLGSLAARLPSSKPNLSDQFRWARQIASALIHVNNSGGFYPDLKPDNIVLRRTPKGEIDAVLIDLEQRGGWFSWSPPEIAYVEYIEILASRAPDCATRDEFTTLLRGYIPDWRAPAQKERYRDVTGGFSAPWLALAAERAAGGALSTLLERAQTFMLGKLLWCIFEGRAVVGCGIDHELLRDPDPEFGGTGAFPEFRETPVQVRDLIRACTAGAPEWEGRKRGLVLRKGKLVPDAWDGEGDVPSAKETREVARRWWTKEVTVAREFLGEVTDASKGGRIVAGSVLGHAMNRPLLSEVLLALERIESLDIAW